MDRKTSQSNEIGYLRWGLIIALFSAIGTYLGVVISYWAWQNPKTPAAESQKLVSGPMAPTPSATPNTFPSPILNTFASPMPSATPIKNSQPAASVPIESEPDSYMVIGEDGRCYASDEEGNILVDDNDEDIVVDCSDL